MPSTVSLGAVDWIVTGSYLVFIIGVGLYCYVKKIRGGATTTTYFLAGRDTPWWAVGLSLFASNIGSEHLIGLAGSGAAGGLAVGWFEWSAAYILLLLGWVFVPLYIQTGVFTMPEFLEKRFSRGCKIHLTFVSILLYVFTKLCVILYSGAIVLETILGWNIFVSSVILIVLTAVYVVLGGLSAVIYTEVFQAVILIGGSMVTMILGLYQTGGLAGLRDNYDIPPSFFTIMKPVDHPDFPWPGVVFCIPAASIWYWCTDQVIVQRALSAKTVLHAKGGCVTAGFLKILPMFMLVLPGIIARALYPEEVIPELGGDYNRAFPVLVVNLLPPGLLGLVVAALLAALMSSLASVFNSTATIITMDLYKPLRPNAGSNELIAVGRIASTLLVACSVVWIPVVQMFSDQIFLYIQAVSNYFAPPITAVFCLGIAWPRMNHHGALAGLVLGLVAGSLRFILELVSDGTASSFGVFVEANYLYFAMGLTLFTVAVGIVVSLLTGRPSPATIEYTLFATGSGLIYTDMENLDLDSSFAGVEPVQLDDESGMPDEAVEQAPDRTVSLLERCLACLKHPSTIDGFACGLLIVIVAFIIAFS